MRWRENVIKTREYVDPLQSQTRDSSCRLISFDAACTRRRLIGGAASAGLALIAAPAIVRVAAAQSWRAGNPFSLGVASGALRPDGFVLWTRLAPDPLSDDPENPGGMSGGDVTLRYEIATDEAMAKVVRRGEATAEHAFGYSVHLDVAGLEPGRPYWYRFSSGDATSPVGRAITLPAAGAALDQHALWLCFLLQLRARLFFRVPASHRRKSGIRAFPRRLHLRQRRPKIGRSCAGTPTGSMQQRLPTYRNRYAQYRLDPDLARLHAQVPALVTWDDHEVQNDYADKWSEYFEDPAQFLLQRAAAYQAFYEHMPVRPILSHPEGPLMRVYDRFSFGDLIEISLIDGRQYRSREACYGPPNKGGGHLETNIGCPERLAAGRSMMGFAQEAWLYSALANSKAQWNLIAQDVLMAQLREKQDGVDAFWTDDWDGYPANRARLLQHIHDSKVSNPVVASGDIHSFFANDLKLDFDDPNSPIVATEFVGTSISSYGPPYDLIAQTLPDNPHVHFFESRRRGYVCVDLQRDKMQVRMRVVSDAHDPKADISTLKTYAIESGHPGVVEA